MKRIINILGTREKWWGSELLPYNFNSRNETNQQTNKRNSLLTLNVSCEERSCLIKTKKKKQNKIIIKKREKKTGDKDYNGRK